MVTPELLSQYSDAIVSIFLEIESNILIKLTNKMAESGLNATEPINIAETMVEVSNIIFAEYSKMKRDIHSKLYEVYVDMKKRINEQRESLLVD